MFVYGIGEVPWQTYKGICREARRLYRIGGISSVVGELQNRFDPLFESSVDYHQVAYEILTDTRYT